MAWWEELTAGGGEGMVVKPVDVVHRGAKGLAQPDVDHDHVGHARLDPLDGLEPLEMLWPDVHQHPELAFEEHETAKAVGLFLKKLGIPFRTGVGKTGIVALLEGSAPGRTIGIRADMDALPIHEETGLAFASKIAGKMHACGHDGHTTMLLGAARYLAEQFDQVITVCDDANESCPVFLGAIVR